MEYTNTSCTILFESPYWIGIFERSDEQGYSVSKFVFGKEPTSPELYNFFLRSYPNKLHYSNPTSDTTKIPKKKTNPKRMQREASKVTQERGISTKAQEALKLQYENNKQKRKKVSKIRKQELEREKFLLKQEKKKLKKRGH
jgi:hypothetical protein